MKKMSVMLVPVVLVLAVAVLLVACSPLVPVACGGELIKVPLDKAQEYKSVCADTVVQPVIEKEQSVVVEQQAIVEKSNDLAHLAYWTTATDVERWPAMDQFDIVACHSDPDSQGNAKLYLLVGKVNAEDLKLTYYNGYSGVLNDKTQKQIIEEIQDSVRPHVPGFTLSTVEIIRLP